MTCTIEVVAAIIGGYWLGKARTKARLFDSARLNGDLNLRSAIITLLRNI